MKTISAAICDDLPEERAALSGMVRAALEERGLTGKLRLFSSGDELVHVFRPGMLQIIFLDIYMPGLSGLDAARAIRQKDRAAAIIFATTSEDHGMESFDVQASDYLVKPFQQADVAAALDWCIEHMPDSARCLTVSSNWESMELPLQSIRYIEILGHQAHIHTERDDIVARRGLDDLEAAIDSPDFLRCHRSYLVNMNHVLGLEGSDFRMNGGDLVPISSANAAKVRSRFIDWTYLKAWGQK